MAEPLVHVLIINWNGREHLAECYDSLLQSTYQNVRFVLLDNASDDGSVSFVRQTYGHDPRVNLIECGGNLGWSRGNNVGLKAAAEAGADYTLLLNNDTATAPEAIERLVAAAEANPMIGALAPKILLYGHPHLLNSMGLDATLTGAAWDRGLGRLDGPRWDTPEQVIGVCGAACLLRMEAVEKVGLLPIDFEIYLDDLDLCLRLWNAGYEIQTCPSAVIRHKFSATMGVGAQARRKYELNTRNRMRIIQRNYPFSQSPAILKAYFTGEIRAMGRAVLDRKFWRIPAHARSWAAAGWYLPRAFRERRRRVKKNIHSCRFWELLRKDLHFFPGTEFPEDGWYSPIERRGKEIRPMSVCARTTAAAGKLRVTQVNCYPELGPLGIDVTCQGRPVITLDTLDWDESVVEVDAGVLEFAARRVFEAEQTGEKMDLGGWVGLEPL